MYMLSRYKDVFILFIFYDNTFLCRFNQHATGLNAVAMAGVQTKAHCREANCNMR
jgi:hypothetical protein